MIYVQIVIWVALIGPITQVVPALHLIQSLVHFQLLPVLERVIATYRATIHPLISFLYGFLPFSLPPWFKDLVALSILNSGVSRTTGTQIVALGLDGTDAFIADRPTWWFERIIWIVSRPVRWFALLVQWVASKATASLRIGRIAYSTIWVLVRGMMLLGLLAPIVMLARLLRDRSSSDLKLRPFVLHARFYFVTLILVIIICLVILSLSPDLT